MKKLLTIIALTTALSTPSYAKPSNMTLVNAHLQYFSAVDNGHAGNRSSYLPRVGKTKGDDYRNCIDQEFNKSVDGSYPDLNAHDFCAWHAEIGKWQY